MGPPEVTKAETAQFFSYIKDAASNLQSAKSDMPAQN